YLGMSGGWIERQQRLPYIQQWNFTIERQVLPDLFVQAAYVGTKGTRLTIQATMLNNTNSVATQTLLDARTQLINTGINPMDTMVANPFYGIIPAGNTTVSGPTISRLNLNKA